MGTVIATAWGALGLSFWIGMTLYNGAPSRWGSRPREDGWDALVLFYLPISLLGGPLMWLPFWWARRSRP